ncbi:MAG: L,D-transpeptidase family protein [Myxococcaceae bacterium]|nr:L,D-transpeptidase family protein [Myxococcaceae bacterium]
MRVFLLLTALSFTAHAEDRVAKARERSLQRVKDAFASAGVTYPPQELHLRAFKKEKVIEVWAGKRGEPLHHVKDFLVCAASGELGPKRKQGDFQVPEGLYEISRFNPQSAFHLSMKVDYPNAADRVLGSPGDLGGDIYIHGNCASVGCLAIEDAPIEELYVMAQDTTTRPITVHIFPSRKVVEASEGAPHAALWQQLEQARLLFDATHRPPKRVIDAKTGTYVLGKKRQ